MTASLIEYCKSHGIDWKLITKTTIKMVKILRRFIEYNAIDEYVTVNYRALTESVVDYFVDTIRITEFHPVKNPNREKNYSYKAYWLLKRKPIQVIKPFERCEFINELFVTLYLMSLICNARNIDSKKKKTTKHSNSFKICFFIT